MAPKQQAPPPPTGFTGFVPQPTMSERFFNWNRARRQQKSQARANRPPRPIITINTGGSGQSSTSRPRRRKYVRRPKQRGLLAATLGMTIAAIAVTAAVAEFVAWETAAELGTVAECISFGTMWFFGEPGPQKPPRPPKPAGPPKPKQPRQPAAQQGSGGHKCGATTQDGSKCGRPVKAATGPDSWCFDHPGGKSKPGATTAAGGTAKPAGPKKTKKKAPPPTVPPPPPAAAGATP